MDPFASAQDLETFLRRDLDTDAAEQAVEMASDEIRGWLKQTLNEATSTEVLFYPRGSTVFLDELPVDPDSIVVTHDDEEVEGWEVDVRAGMLFHDRWPGPVKVTYTHGYTEEQLATAKRVCLYAAARIYVNPEQTMQKRRGDYSASYGSSTVESSGLTSWERILLSRAYPSPQHAV